jgi:thioredoxin-dependent peroxiredoxin
METISMKTLATMFAVLALLALAAPGLAQEQTLSVGDEAPDFTLKASDGKTYKLADFKGKQAVVVAWFPRAFTGGCTKECKSMREAGEKLRGYEAAYFTASTDPVEKNADFAKSLDLDYPILSDPKGEVAKKYGVYNAERDAAARVTFYIGKDGKLLHIDRQVKTDTHGEDIAARLGSLGVEKK